MANFSKKSKDPTEVALSAIQDALNVREAEQKASIAASPVTVPLDAVVPPVVADTQRTARASTPKRGEESLLDPAGGVPTREELPTARPSHTWPSSTGTARTMPAPFRYISKPGEWIRLSPLWRRD